MYFPHPRFRRRALLCVATLLCGVLACARSADESSHGDSARAAISARTGASTAASASASSATPADTDDFGAALPRDASFATRVVSLNPAATEVIFAIGAESHLVARSRWDEYPVAAKTLPEVGDGIRPNIEAVLAQRPTLVVLYATAENRAAAEALNRAGVHTLTLRVDHIAQFVSMVGRLGVALGAVDRAKQVADSVQQTLEKVRAVTRTAAAKSAVWPLWQQPVMVVGSGSYLDELLEIAGARNVFHDMKAPSPQVSVEEIAQRNPDVIVASAFTRTQLRTKPQWNAVRAMRDDQWVIDDPAVTGRPSVVLGMAAVSLARALHPELADQLPALAVPTLRKRD